MSELKFTNIFDAISDDSAEAVDLEFRADMMLALRNYFDAQKWSTADIMAALEIPQPRVSELMGGKVSKFSSDKLIRFLAKVGYQIKPTLKVKKDSSVSFKCSTKELDIA
ncbi:helix-turn-helix domain-containing protein [Marinomonas algarum]|uniref:XRE family transcriptional regulator n=1 Tax=Marinomonas algarum TaxID=2883105 RepID=A0A9X1LFU8_9GAMM|nr:XRE family transcriptional regulator [Marinomonas algarum]MCB5163185.1 XRE family transcriptional regulator [Marinomonas algarum]